MAKLHYYFGTMGSGKSTDVLRVAHSYEETGMQVLIAKPLKDTKANSKIESRIGMDREVDILAPPRMNIEKEVLARQQIIGEINCLITDESQFFTPRQVDQFFNLAVIHSIAVVSFGLRTDFRTKSFPGSKRLFEMAHEINHQKMVCRCSRRAMFNTRYDNGKAVFEGDQVAIDGENNTTYVALCGKCYLEERGSAQYD